MRKRAPVGIPVAAMISENNVMRVSVCIATFNGSLYIKEQLESILCQLNDSDEIIISDDNSTDRTIAIIREIADKRIKVFSNDGERGCAKNFENAIKKSTGDVIFLADQDDIWDPRKVALCLEALKRYDFVVSDCSIVNEGLTEINDSYYNFRKCKKGLFANLVRFSYLGCCMAFRESIKDRILPFPENQKLFTHDNWIFLISALFYKVGYLDEKLIKYRRHLTNASGGGEKTTNSIYFMLAYRSYIVLCLLLSVFRVRERGGTIYD